MQTKKQWLMLGKNKFLKQFILKVIWLLIYLIFNVSVFFIELHVLFNKAYSGNESHSGYKIIDFFYKSINMFFSGIESLAFVAFQYFSIGTMLVAFLIFIPIELMYIQPKCQGGRKEFYFDVIISLSLVILLKMIVYIFIFMDS